VCQHPDEALPAEEPNRAVAGIVLDTKGETMPCRRKSVCREVPVRGGVEWL
jgi:hypothetical protein